MTDTPTPEWNLLPDFPARFFGLSTGFEREELKRAYGALIKKFKPDKSPNEFKMIRAAYEQLDRSLRYGRTQADADSQRSIVPFDEVIRSELDAPNQKSVSDAEDISDRVTPKELVLQQLAQSEPKVVFETIRSKTNKSPFDFYVLAILADVVGEESAHFGYWLAKGMESHPHDASLISLQAEYLKTSEMSAEAMHELLMHLAKSLQKSSFFYLTEPLWFRYVQRCDWNVFHETLKVCDRLTTELDIHAKVAFYVGLIRRAMWKAPLDWLQETVDWIEREASSLHGSLDIDFEINSKLLLMRYASQDILSRGRFGILIMDTVKSYCEQEETEFINAMIDCQSTIANNPTEFFEAFPYSETCKLEVLQGWDWISYGVLSQMGGDDDTSNATEIDKEVFALMERMEKDFPMHQSLWIQFARFSYWGTFFASGLVVTVALVSFAFLLVAKLLAYINVKSPWLAVTLVFPLGTFVLCLFGAQWLHHRTVSIWDKRVLSKFFSECLVPNYEKVWRVMLSQLFVEHHYFYGNVLAVSKVVLDQRKQHFFLTTWLSRFLANDAGLMLYSIAVRFVR